MCVRLKMELIYIPNITQLLTVTYSLDQAVKSPLFIMDVKDYILCA